MSQFEAHRNTGRNSAVIPFVVVIQSAAFNDLCRRLVCQGCKRIDALAYISITYIMGRSQIYKTDRFSLVESCRPLFPHSDAD